jgi:hypothetical protein
MVGSEYVTGRISRDGMPAGEAHAVLAEAGRGAAPFTAECGQQVEVADGAFPPQDIGVCPACSRVTGLAV